MLRFSWISCGAVAFLAGVLSHAAFPFDPTPTIIVAGLVGAAGCVAWIAPVRYRWIIAACLVGLAFGLWRFDLSLPGTTSGPASEFAGTVIEEGRYDVSVRDDTTRLTVAIASRQRIGERVRVSCSRIEPINHDTKSIFDARKGVWFKCRGGASVRRTDGGQRWNIQGLLAEWRKVLTLRVQRILPGDAGALLAGTLYGERGLSAEASARFKSAGMTHLIAVSGSNIAIVASLFVPFFVFLGYRRRFAIVISGLAIFLFVIFVGAQASVVRAATMGWLALLARAFGRKAQASRLLVIAATLIVLVDPWALAFDAGFALSFLATWGLLSWARPFQQRLKWIPELFGLREAAGTTLAATVSTFPYSLWAFGSASAIGLLTNLLAVPLIPLAMLWGAIAVAIGPMLPVLALPARGVLEAMLAIARISDVIPWLRVAWALPTWGLFLCYGVIAWISFKRGKKKVAYPQFSAPESAFPSFWSGPSASADRLKERDWSNLFG